MVVLLYQKWKKSNREIQRWYVPLNLYYDQFIFTSCKCFVPNFHNQYRKGLNSGVWPMMYQGEIFSKYYVWPHCVKGRNKDKCFFPFHWLFPFLLLLQCWVYLSSQSGRLWLLPTLSVCLSHFYGLCLGYYGLDFNQTWWECWNWGPIWAFCGKGKKHS